MEQREKLIELIKESDWFAVEFDRSGDASFAINFREIADHLLANGVVVLPCRCGECEYRGTDDCPMHIKGVAADEEFLVKVDNDYCSYVKRKGGDE